MALSLSSIAKDWVFEQELCGFECFVKYQEWCTARAATGELTGLEQQLLVGYIAYYLEPDREAPKFLRCFENIRVDNTK